MAITAKGRLNGHDIEATVTNPNGWFGKVQLVEIGGSYAPFFLAIEADSEWDALDELAEHPKYKHHIVVDEKDYGDYPEENRLYGPNGEVLDLDHIALYGQWDCKYYDDHLPLYGITPTQYDAYIALIDDSEVFQLVPMPLNADGQGPETDYKKVVKVEWQVWTEEDLTVACFDDEHEAVHLIQEIQTYKSKIKS